MVDGDFVGPGHGLSFRVLATNNQFVAEEDTYKFVVYLDTLQNQANPFISNRVQPFGLMGGVDMRCVVVHQIDSGCFGVSYVCYIVYMALITIISPERNIDN